MKIKEDFNSLPRYNNGSGAGWKSKKMVKKTRGNQTPGHQKGESCKASTLDRYMAKTSRSYKHPNFGAWSAKIREQCRR